MPIERKGTIILALEWGRKTEKILPEKANDLILRIERDQHLSSEEKEFIDNFLAEYRINSVFSGLSKRGVSC